MARKKKETLVHLDLETYSRPVRPRKKAAAAEKKPETLGEMLRFAREKNKLKLSDIAQKLRIKEVYLEALEQGHYYVFPGLVYGIGFLRTYAQFLELDATEMVELFHQETSGIETEPLEMPVVENKNALPSGRIVVQVVFLFAAFYLIWRAVAFLFLTDGAAPALPDELTALSAEAELTGAEDIEPPLTADEIDLTLVKAVAPPPAATPEAKPAPQRIAKTYGLKTPAKLSLAATREVWIEVRDKEADSVIFSRLLQAGDRYNPALRSEGLVLKTGDAGALSLYMDGVFVKALGRSGEVRSEIPLDASKLAE